MTTKFDSPAESKLGGFIESPLGARDGGEPAVPTVECADCSVLATARITSLNVTNFFNPGHSNCGFGIIQTHGPSGVAELLGIPWKEGIIGPTSRQCRWVFPEVPPIFDNWVQIGTCFGGGNQVCALHAAGTGIAQITLTTTHSSDPGGRYISLAINRVAGYYLNICQGSPGPDPTGVILATALASYSVDVPGTGWVTCAEIRAITGSAVLTGSYAGMLTTGDVSATVEVLP